MQAIFYTNFKKRRQSTKQPTGGTTKEILLKEECSLINPVFILNEVDYTINYCNWNGRYYFVNDVVAKSNTMAEYHCVLDELATYKADIGDYTAFVERSASNYDIMINDNELSAKQNIINRRIAYTELGATAINMEGTYFIRVVNATVPSLTGVTTYATTKAGLADILSWAYSVDSYDFLTDDITKAIFDPGKYITQVYWLPVNIAQFTTYADFKLGMWSPAQGLQRPIISNSGVTFTQTVNIPTNHYNDFRAYNNNFTNIKLYIPAIGQIDVDPLLLQNSNVINTTYDLDFTTGDVVVRVSSGASSENDNNVFSILKGNWKVPIQIAYTESVSKGVFDNVLSSTSNFMTGNIGAGISNFVNAVTTITAPNVSSLGDMGTLQTFNGELRKLICSLVNYESTEFATVEVGRPLYKNVKINTLNGYLKCANASVPIDGDASEIESVNRLLNNGFYYE